MLTDRDLIQQLKRTDIFSHYESAFSEALRLPMAIRPADAWAPALRGHKFENPFCALMAETNRSCAACLEVQDQAAKGARDQPATITCFAGLSDSAVPIRVGERLVGFLQTGQVALTPRTKAGFARITRRLLEWGLSTNIQRLEEAYFHSKVLSPKQYASMIKLLEVFAKHLSVVANQLAVDSPNESPFVRKAKAYIARHQDDQVTLEQAAAAMNVSTFYFCKLFKKATGMTFTEYLGRVRVEKAKNLLLNPHLRISEIAYSVGFQSLTHFNRLFRQFAGESPSNFRLRQNRKLARLPS
jgi:AraC-like DNA-binding protein/ligand-binding sensor protein